MGLEKIAAENLNFYAPRFQVEIEGKKLEANISKAIIDAAIEEKLDEGASFRLTIHDEFDLEKREFKWLDHQLFEVGNKVSIKFGYGGELHTMIVGNITGLEPSFFSGETPTITITGQDLSFDYMKRITPERTFKDKTISDIAKTIAREAGLNPVVEEVKLEPSTRCKDNTESYWSFLQSINKGSDYEFKLEGQTLYFVKPKDDEKEIFSLELGKDIISFRPSLRTTGIVTEVEVRGHNHRDPGKPIVGRATAGDERSQEKGKKTASNLVKERHGEQKKVITNVIVNSKKHADSIAKAELNKLSDTLIEGEVESIGIPRIRTGVTIGLEKMGKRFSGKYYVKETTHTINNSGYRTRFSVKRNAI